MQELHETPSHTAGRVELDVADSRAWVEAEGSPGFRYELEGSVVQDRGTR